MTRLQIQAPAGKILADTNAQFLYHRKQVGTDKSQTINYFKDIGSGVTRLDTNLDISGMLSQGHTFDIWGISFVMAFGTPFADVIKYYNSTYYRLYMGGSVFHEGPMHIVPSCCGLRGVVATTNSDKLYESYSNGEAHPQAYLPLAVGRQPMRLPSQHNIYVETVIAAATDFSAAFYTWYYLHGIYRKGVPVSA